MSKALPTPTSAPPLSATPLPPASEDEAAPPPPSPPRTPPPPSPACPQPKLRLRISDLSHPGAVRFLSLSALDVIQHAIQDVWTLLYLPAAVFEPDSRPPRTKEVRSLTVYLEDMAGVAYTKGSELDESHKEMHISLSYLANIPAALVESEIRGVVTHEMVHVFQHDAHGTAPSGLIEGVADWVRYRAGLGAKHWRKDNVGDSWDAGYERTAFFLMYVAKRVERCRARAEASTAAAQVVQPSPTRSEAGESSAIPSQGTHRYPKTPHPRTFVPHLNALLSSQSDWSGSHLFEDLTGRQVDEWWSKYVRHVRRRSSHDGAKGLAGALGKLLSVRERDGTDDEVDVDSDSDDA